MNPPVIHIYARRLVAGLALLLLVPAPIVAQGTAGSSVHRQPLSIWWAEWCGVCKRMALDIKAEPAFHAEFHQRFAVKWVNADATLNKVQAPLAGVRALPTIIGPGGRIEGYTGLEDLALRLGMRWRPQKVMHTEPQPRPPPAAAQPPQETPPAVVPAAALDGMQERINRLKADGDERWHSLSDSLAQVREWIEQDNAGEHLGKIGEAVEQLRGDLDAVKRAQLEAGSPKFVPQQPLPESKPAIDEQRSPTGGLWGTIATIGGLLGVPSWLIAIGGATGVGAPVLAGGWVALKALDWWRSRRSPAAPQPNSQPSSTPPEASEPTVIRELAPYETDSFREAFEYAKVEFARKYPASAGSVETVEAMIDQYLSSKGLSHAVRQ